MRISENRKLACIVLVVCILLSVFGFGGLALSRERSKVLKVFDEGADTSLSTRHSMDAYLDAAAASAQLMVSEAERFLGTSPLIDSVSEDAKTVAEATNLDARNDGYTALKTDVDKLYNGVYDVAKDDFTNFKMAYDDFWGSDDFIRHDEYHALARDYNKLCGGFPASLVALVTGQGSLNTFGG